MMNSRHKELAIRLKKTSDVVNVLVTIFAVALFTIMLSLSLIAIFFQFILNEPLTWTYSLTRLFLPWIAMLSITVALKHNEHIGVTMAIQHLPKSALRVVQLVSLCIVAFFGVMLTWYGIGFFENSTQFYMVSDNLQVSHKWTAASVPLAGLVICIHLLSGLALVEHPDVMEQLELEET